METRIGQSFDSQMEDSETMVNSVGLIQEEKTRIGREGRC